MKNKQKRDFMGPKNYLMCIEFTSIDKITQ